MVGWIDRSQVDKWTDRWMNRKIKGWMNKQMDGWINRQMDGFGKWTDGVMD